MGVGVVIDCDHCSQAKQAKVTATFLHSCLREKAEHRNIPCLKSLCLASFYIKRIGFHCGRDCNWISPWKEVVIRFLSRSTNSVPGKTKNWAWVFFSLAGELSIGKPTGIGLKATGRKGYDYTIHPWSLMKQCQLWPPKKSSWPFRWRTESSAHNSKYCLDIAFGREHGTFLWVKPSESWSICLLVSCNLYFLEKGKIS